VSFLSRLCLDSTLRIQRRDTLTTTVTTLVMTMTMTLSDY